MSFFADVPDFADPILDVTEGRPPVLSIPQLPSPFTSSPVVYPYTTTPAGPIWDPSVHMRYLTSITTVTQCNVERILVHPMGHCLLELRSGHRKRLFDVRQLYALFRAHPGDAIGLCRALARQQSALYVPFVVTWDGLDRITGPGNHSIPQSVSTSCIARIPPPPQSSSLLHWLHSSGGRDIPLPALPSFVTRQWPRVMDMCQCSDVIVPEFQICMTGLGRGSMRIRWALRHSTGFKNTIFLSDIPHLLVANATDCLQVVCVLREVRNMLPPRALPIDGWNLIHELSSARGKPRIGSCVFIPYGDLRTTTTGTGVCIGVLRGKYPAGLSRSAPGHTWVEYGTDRWCYEVPDDLVFAARCDAEMYLQNAVVEGWWMLPA